MTREKMEELQLRAAHLLATRSEKFRPITSVDNPPPCFESGSAYKQWLMLAASAPPPARKDFPAEPNYCRDCTREGQKTFKEQGRCLFPMTRFQEVKDVEGDEETVGYTPKRFLPQTVHGSFGHSIEPVGDGLYETRWVAKSSGQAQTKIVDLDGAERFAERWGITFEAGEPG